MSDKEQKSPKDILTKWSSETGIPGIPKLAGSKSIWKFLWTVNLLLLLTILIWQCHLMVQKYFSYPTSVNIKLGTSEVDFPAITVCNLNNVRKSQLSENEDGNALLGLVDELEKNADYNIYEVPSKLRRMKRKISSTAELYEALDTKEVKKTEPNSKCMLFGYFSKKQRELARMYLNISDPNKAPIGVCTKWRAPIGNGKSANTTTTSRPTTAIFNATTPGTTTTTTPDTTLSSFTNNPDKNTKNVHGNMEKSTAQKFVIQHDEYYPDDYFTPPEPDLEAMPWYRKRIDPAFTTRNKVLRAISKIRGANQVKMSHQATDFIQELVYNGEVLSPGDMSAFTSPYFGVCYTFNARSGKTKVKRAIKSGPAHGVSLVMFIEQNEYVGHFSQAAGVKVVIHQNDARPFPYDEGLDITPGQLTSIGLRQSKFARLKPPYGICTDGKDKPFIGRELLYKVNYTVVACERSCLQYYTIDKCGCADSITPAPKGAILCEEDQDDCIKQVTAEYSNGDLKCDCPLPCAENVLEKSMSVSQWPSVNYGSQLEKSMSLRGGALEKAVTTGGAGENLLKVSIFFETLSLKTYEEKRSYLIPDLLSDIGGQLGLWVGLSAISGLEVIEMLYALGKSLYALARRGKNDRVEESNHIDLNEKSPMTLET